MGVGKTTVCRRLQERLGNCVFLDGDWCWDANPFTVTEETKKRVEENICFLLNQFLRCSAYDNVVFCWVMHQQGIIDGILRKLDTAGCRVHTVSLTADPEALSARILGDVEKGLRCQEDVERSVSRLPLYQALSTEKIGTTGKSPEQVAGEIQALGEK